MAENPLLPNAKLKQLYSLMQRARVLARKTSAKPGLEAVWCATLVQLEAGDFVSPPQRAAALAALAAEHLPRHTARLLPPLPERERLAIVAGVAHGLTVATGKGMAVYYADGSRAPGWQHVLPYAAQAELPLLLVCIESNIRASNTRASSASDALTWPALSALAQKIGLPVLPVDASDPVAIYRVMQECSIRARHLGGPAVVLCVPPRPAASPANDPLRKLARYLKARGIRL